MKPIVTAFITVYNGEKYIERSVKSLLDQTVRDIEVLIIDDGSNDRTPQILGSMVDDRLRVVYGVRRGRGGSLALAASLAKGEYLANLDADDESLPCRLAEQVRFLSTNRDHTWVGSAEDREDTLRGEHVKRAYPEKDRDIRIQASRCIPYCHSAVMFRKKIIDSGINYDPRQKFLIDFEFFIRVARKYKVANLPDALVRHRVYKDSFFRKNFSTYRQNIKLSYLCGRAIRELGLPGQNYIYPLLRLGYPCLPNNVKRLIRKVGGIKEASLE